MSTSPIVAEQLHKQNTPTPSDAAPDGSERLHLPTPEPRVWSSVDLPSLNLSDPIGTTVRLPLTSEASGQALKKADLVPTPPSRAPDPAPALDEGLAQRKSQLRATSAGLRRQTEAVSRTTGTLK
jgi:hypothetical protein